ncbi:hypothetical protein CLOM_g1477 [Closterium sp. NIES-68]|nr:hypothetical protein CLOM_g1477 [Closterium sp. NIES-68]
MLPSPLLLLLLLSLTLSALSAAGAAGAAGAAAAAGAGGAVPIRLTNGLDFISSSALRGGKDGRLSSSHVARRHRALQDQPGSGPDPSVAAGAAGAAGAPPPPHKDMGLFVEEIVNGTITPDTNVTGLPFPANSSTLQNYVTTSANKTKPGATPDDTGTDVNGNPVKPGEAAFQRIVPPSPPFPSPPPPVVAFMQGTYINCGSNESLANPLYTWAADTFSGSFGRSFKARVLKTSMNGTEPAGRMGYGKVEFTETGLMKTPPGVDARVFETVRYFDEAGRNVSTYSVPVPGPPANVFLRLYFAEIVYTSARLRRFHVAVEGTHVLTNYSVPRGSVRVEEFIVPVLDGAVDIAFIRGEVGEPMISAIAVVPLTAGMYNLSAPTASSRIMATDYRFGCGLFLPISDLTQRIWNLLPQSLYTPTDPGSRRYNNTHVAPAQWPQTVDNADKPPFMYPLDLTTAGLQSVEYSSYAGYNGNTFINFSLPVDPNTAYRIDFGFEELWYYYTARLLDFYVDGTLLFKELDLASVAGVGVPYSITLNVVSGPSGYLNIFLNTSTNSLHNNVFISTLEVFRQLPTDLANQAVLRAAALPCPPPAPFMAVDTTPAPTAPSSSSAASLGIGIAVGMVIILLLLAALTAFVVMRARRRQRQVQAAQETAAAEAGYNGGSSKSHGGASGAPGGGAFSDSALLALISGKFGATGEDEKHKAFKNLDAEATARTGLFGARIFTLSELRRATDDFASGNLIGQGGFGKVYRATLGGSGGDGAEPAVPGFEVAVKRLGAGSQQGASEFLTEVRLLSRLHHKNLVNLIGYCDEDSNQLILVYEYAPNGTLKDYLRDVVRVKSLSWDRRLRIAITAASGLEYLHNGASPSVIHRDIKTSNILLDYSFNAKVADFGLSKLGKKAAGSTGVGMEEKTDKSHISTRVKGTLGYLDPMYYTKQHLTDKSDVFSFGVVLLELITGRLPIWQEDDSSGLQSSGESLINLVEWTEPFLKSGQIRPIVAPTLDSDRHMQSLMKVADLAYRCVRTQPKSRPSMAEVARILAEAKSLLDAEGAAPGSAALPLPTPAAAASSASTPSAAATAGAGFEHSLLESSLKVGDTGSALLMDEAGAAFLPQASVSAAAAAAAAAPGPKGDYENPFSISVISE